MFLDISQNSQENTCTRVSFLIKLKRDSGTVVFLWILRNFQEHFFYRTLLDDCFQNSSPFKRQSQKMVKHTETIRRQQTTNCLSVFDHFVWLAFKGLIIVMPIMERNDISVEAYFKTRSSIYDGDFCDNSKRFSVVNYFHKKHHFRCLTGFWMCLCSKTFFRQPVFISSFTVMLETFWY